MDADTEYASKVAALNDAFRKSGVRTMVTPGVREFEDMGALVSAVRSFSTFTEYNDPYGEHDFGTLKWHGQTVFWKIDCYDASLKYGGDPLDPKSKRVLTIMLGSEY